MPDGRGFDAHAQQQETVAPAAGRRNRRIAIIGFGNTAKQAPFSDASWELWGLNGFWRVAKDHFGMDVPEERWSCWLDMHAVDYLRDYGKRAGIGDSQEKWLEQPHPFPVYMLEANPAFPSVQAYPINELIQGFNRDYFTSGVAYALALALATPDVVEIGLWGIDLVHKTEYQQQRPCAEYWIGRAEERGIKITVADESALLKQRHRYGYNQADPLSYEMRNGLLTQAEGLHKAIEENKAKLEALTAQLHTDSGALQMVNQLLERLDVYDRGGRV